MILNQNIENMVEITATLTNIINYAVQQNKIDVIKQILIKNISSLPIENAVLKLSSTEEFMIPAFLNLPVIMPGETIEIRENNNKNNVLKCNIELNGNYIVSISEKVASNFVIEVLASEKEGAALLGQKRIPIIVLPYDEWQGYGRYPELLASYVMPNSGEINEVILESASFLEKWTGDPSLDGYQSRDPNRVKKQFAAVYSALQKQNIIYSVPLASFDSAGQRIRLADAVFSKHMGTCLDISLIYAACLEAMGLHPLIILQSDHAFVGVWLDEQTFPESVIDDCAALTKRVSEGISQIAICETTSLCAGTTMNFEHAVKLAEEKLIGVKPIECIIDVYRARLSGISPLPVRIKNIDGSYSLKNNEKKVYSNVEPKNVEQIKIVEQFISKQTRKDQWERRLLDLSLRNSLINIRLTSKYIPLFSTSAPQLEDALSDGTEFKIETMPSEIDKIEGKNNFEGIVAVGKNNKLIEEEFKNKRLRTIYSENELQKLITKLYRISRSSFEENGANTLYLACGFLRWYETVNSKMPRYAPIVLLPVEILRKSAKKGYVIRLRDEDPQMNITLLEFLKRDFGIEISGLDPLPTDETGVDLKTVFATIRHGIMSQKNWDIVDAVCLGIFSFSQFVMWNDIRNRGDDLEKNPIVKSLMEGRYTFDDNPDVLSNDIDEGQVLLPIAADASQLKAIYAAEKGESFVLHGPPGTGKSQTITSIIANALANGKTVLFVAEKMAALSVVEKRLNKIGIGPFCLNLHSNKAKKSEVLDQLKVATEILTSRPSIAFKNEAEKASRVRLELNAYRNAIHEKRSNGFSVHEMIERYEENKNCDSTIKFDGVFASSITEEIIDDIVICIERLIAAGKAVGHPCGHPYRAVQSRSFRSEMLSQLRPLIDLYENSTGEYIDAVDDYAKKAELDIKSRTEKDYKAIKNTAYAMITLNDYPAEIVLSDDLKTLEKEIERLATLEDETKNGHDRLLKKWKESFFDAETEKHLKTISEINNSGFVGKLFRQNSIKKEFKSQFKGSSFSLTELKEDLELLEKYNLLKNERDLLSDKYRTILDAYSNEKTIIISDKIKEVITIKDALSNYDINKETIEKCYHDSTLSSLAKKVLETNNVYEKTKNEITDLYSFDWTWYGGELSRIKDEVSADLLSGADLRDWITYNNLKDEIINRNFEAVVKGYQNGIPHDDLIISMKNGLYRSMAEYYIDSDTVLSKFSGNIFNEIINQFEQIENELTKATQAEIYYRLSSKVPDFTKQGAQSSELGILQRCIKRNGRGTSLRQLFAQIPNLLPRVCPCMLMSPISAAQYLDPSREPFDIVVFDEASQIQTCKAVGAIARGKSAVIVGDPNQMPPTTFFTTIINNDEEDMESEDLESVLDDLLSLGMPQSHLLWHYRSRHESLISFSNKEFYDNKLNTFPSYNDKETKVSFTKIDGVFDRGKTRTNIEEAKAVVREIVRRKTDQKLKESSIGIVTFNIQQQNLIDDLLLEEYKKDPELERTIATEEENLFIKNLENVQGDERDVILISVGYGPDSAGKVHMNFGPLNRDGGWRRLNVAITRARSELHLFSSITYDMIDMTRTSARGVETLRDFLEFAQNGRFSSKKIDYRKDGIIEDIANNLRRNGYEVQTNIGTSKFKVDIGIVDPKEKSRYLCGLMTDGDIYSMAETVHDREASHVSVLKGLGWNIRRVWSIDWWNNPEKELQNIISFINNISESTQISNKNTAVVKETKKEVATIKDTREAFKGIGVSYTACDLEIQKMTSDNFVSPTSNRKLVENIIHVLDVESPVSEEYLCSRAVKSFGLTMSNQKAVSKCIELIRKIAEKEDHVIVTEEGDKRFYWYNVDPEKYDIYRINNTKTGARDPEDISKQEIANAIEETLREQIGLPYDSLIKEVSKKLGYVRTTVSMAGAVDRGLMLSIQRKVLSVSDDKYVTISPEE